MSYFRCLSRESPTFGAFDVPVELTFHLKNSAKSKFRAKGELFLKSSPFQKPGGTFLWYSPFAHKNGTKASSGHCDAPVPVSFNRVTVSCSRRPHLWEWRESAVSDNFGCPGLKPRPCCVLKQAMRQEGIDQYDFAVVKCSQLSERNSPSETLASLLHL